MIKIPELYCIALQKLKLCVYNAIVIFNYGRKGSLDIVTELNVEPVVYTKKLRDELIRRKKSLALYKPM